MNKIGLDQVKIKIGHIDEGLNFIYSDHKKLT